jgi:predicted dehydrogenase
MGSSMDRKRPDLPYRAALIGCGRVAWMLEDDPLEKKPCTHMGAYMELGKTGRVEVTAASDADPARLSEFGKRYGIENLYLDYREMLLQERPEIVSICAWAPERAAMVVDAVEAGARGVWCEKAVATSMDEATAILKAAEAAGAEMIVSHMRRWSPEYAKAKEIIENGGIGTLQSITSHFSGSFIHTGTHAFDVLRWFGGDIEWIEGTLEEGGGTLPWYVADDRGGRAFIKFKNGAHAAVFAESKGYFFFEFDIVGSHGRIRIGNNELLEYYRPSASRHYTGFKELYTVEFPEFEEANIWTSALTNLMDAMEGRARSRNGPVDGMSALEAALAVHESARRGSKIYLPLESSLKIRSR